MKAVRAAYAKGTTVAVEKTRMEIDKLLTNHGAARVAILADNEHHRASVLFVIRGAEYRLEVPLPTVKDLPSRVRGRDTAKPLAQAGRERWRAVLLLLKAKLELVRLGVSSVEREFMADRVLPNGQTVHAALANHLTEIVSDNGRLPKLLGAG